ncbi:MAG: hypothetical protein ABL966_04710, partial [Acidimicrobiales bacterium]
MVRTILVITLVGASCTSDDAAQEIADAARAWIDASAPLTAEAKATLVHDATVERDDVSHVRFSQEFDGVPVDGSEYIVIIKLFLPAVAFIPVIELPVPIDLKAG